MKKFVVHYHFCHEDNDPRTMILKASTMQDAIVIFNNVYALNCKLLYIEEYKKE